MNKPLSENEFRKVQADALRLPPSRWVMTGNLTLSSKASTSQFLDPNGSDRDVTLPGLLPGTLFVISHIGGANTLSIKDSGAVEIALLTNGKTVLLLASEEEWVVFLEASAGGGGAVDDAYKVITDGTTPATASGEDTFKLRASDGVDLVTQSNDVTHGDNVLVQLTALSALSVLANATNSSARPTALAASTDGHVLRRNGTALEFGLISLTGASITGTLALANGGTGETTALAAFEALSPITTKGDLVTNNGANDIRLGVGTDGQVIIANSAAAAGLSYDAANNHIHTAVDISDFIESVDDQVAALLVGGTNITLTYNDGLGTLTIDADGDVTKVGTPVDNQIGVWTGDGTLEGDSNLTWDGSLLSVTGDLALEGFVDLDEIATPANPAANIARIYAFDDGGTTKLAFRDSAGAETVVGAGGGSSIILDLGDDGSNESTAIGEIATTGDTNSIFTEPSADKLLIDVSINWPTADTVADNAITLAKLASGTAGELPTWDASGDPAAVAVGTAAQVLTSNGAGAAPTFQDLPGGISEVGDTTVGGAVSEVAFTSSVIDAAADYTKVSVGGLSLSGTGNLAMRLSDDNGSTFTNFLWGEQDNNTVQTVASDAYLDLSGSVTAAQTVDAMVEIFLNPGGNIIVHARGFGPDTVDFRAVHARALDITSFNYIEISDADKSVNVDAGRVTVSQQKWSS